MSSFKTTFAKQHTFLPVVHVEDYQQALRNARLAKEGGADGIFIINHEIEFPHLLECHRLLRKELPNFWIGLNCLDLGRSAVNQIPSNTNGLWVDDAGIDEGIMPTATAESFAKERARSGWKGLYFGGVAFKYLKEVVDPGEAARLAIPYVDVITTSGVGTGYAPEIEKIKTMKKAIGDHPLAIASGITPENVGQYMPYADCFLVATGVSDSHTELNYERVRTLAAVLS